MTQLKMNALLIKSPKILFIILAILGCVFLYFIRVEMLGFEDRISEITHSKGALLVIITVVPFIFIYFTLVYVVINFFTKINTVIFNNESIDFIGKIKTHINKKDVKEIRLIKNKNTQNYIRIIFILNSSVVYSLNFINADIIDCIVNNFNLKFKTPEIIEFNNESKEIYRI